MTTTKTREMPNFYEVKFRRKGINEKKWRFGIFDRFGPEAKERWERGRVVIDDAVLPLAEEYDFDNLEIEEVPLTPPKFENGEFVPCNEFDEYVANEYTKAKAKAKEATGLVGKMFSVGVADGKAFYVITKENKKTVRVEWRGFGMDRYTDQILGWGGTLDKDRAKSLVKANEGLAALFRKKS